MSHMPHSTHLSPPAIAGLGVVAPNTRLSGAGAPKAQSEREEGEEEEAHGRS